MRELNNSIYHEPGVGLLALVEFDGAQRFFTQQGLASLIEMERRHLHDVSSLVEALDELSGADRDYQHALDDFRRRCSRQIQSRDWSHDPPRARDSAGDGENHKLLLM